MELIQVYETCTGLETLFTVVAILTLIAAVVVFAVTLTESCTPFKSKMIGAVVSTVLLVIFIVSVIINIKTEDITAYKYYVKDPQQLSQMLDRGYEIDSSDEGDHIYDLIKSN